MLPILKFNPKISNISAPFSSKKPFKFIQINRVPSLSPFICSNSSSILKNHRNIRSKQQFGSIEWKRWNSAFAFEFGKKEEEKKEAYDPSVHVQKYLRKFFLRIHPDLYTKNTDMQSVNQKNLSELNRLVAMTKKKKSQQKEGNVLVDKYPKSCKFHFFFNASGDSKMENIQEARVEIDLEVNEEKPADEKKTDFTVKLYDGLYVLFKESGVDVPEGERWDAESPYRRTEKLRKSREVRWANMSADSLSDRDVYEYMKENLWYQKRQDPLLRKWELNDLIDQEESKVDLDMIFYSPSLNEKEREKALEHLNSLVVVLDQQLFFWSDMPIMFTKDSWTGEKETTGDGVIYIPYSFTEEQIIEHFKNNLNKIRERRASERHNMISVAEARTELLESLELSDIGLHKSLTASQLSICLEKMRKPETMSKFAKFVLRDLNIFIGPNEMGYSVVPHLNGFRIPADFDIEKVIQLLKETDLDLLRSKAKKGRIHLENLSKETFVLLEIFGKKPYFSPQLFESLSKEEQIQKMSRLKKIALKLGLARNMKKPIMLGDKFLEGEDNLEIPCDINKEEVHFILKYGASYASVLQERRDVAKSLSRPVQSKKEANLARE
eukprot:TRINITY_DN7073_c0_g1_i1.p1 TRINITY_DN7073_c0_g1~~TRINITY_DN7073_c0_g1_i1.p1  ORF type:complete len:609 (+),score=225.70 TRINITY_DN7073_c0_g1_i1:89-1915(+)